MSIATIGLDIAKSVFQVHGIDGDGEVALCRKLQRSELIPSFGEARPVHGDDGGVRCRAPLGPRAGRPRP